MNECAIDESFGPKDETEAMFWMMLNAHSDVACPAPRKSCMFGKDDCSLMRVVISSNLLPSRDMRNPSGVFARQRLHADSCCSFGS